MRTVKLSNIYLFSIILVSFILILFNILIFRYRFLPKYIEDTLKSKIGKIDLFFIDRINYIYDILEYTEYILKKEKSLSNDFLDTLRFKSNIFSRYYNIWDALLIINDTSVVNINSQVQNIIVYNGSIFEFINDNDLNKIFSLDSLKDKNSCFFLEKIAINNNKYLIFIYKADVNSQIKFIALIVNSAFLESEIKKIITNNVSYVKLSLAYDQKLNQLYYEGDHNTDFNICNINKKNTDNIRYSKFCRLFVYKYSIPRIGQNIPILIRIDYPELIKINFLDLIYMQIILIIFIIFIFFIAINHVIKNILEKSNLYCCNIFAKKKLNNNHVIIDEIQDVYYILSKLYEDFLTVQSANKYLNNEKQLLIYKQRKLFLALENALNNYELYTNFLTIFINENNFYYDSYYYYRDLCENWRAREDQLMEFIAIASHEIKTPLGSIIGFVDIIKNYYKNLDNKLIEYLEYIDECSQYILILIDELINMVKINDNSLKIEKDIISIYDTIKQCIRYIEHQSRTKNIAILLKIDRNFPNVFFDLQCIKQIIINILINSINYSPENTEINISVVRQNKDLIITIQDNGYGFDSDQLSLVTKKYYTKSEQGTGFGLGLFLVKKLVEMHGGKMIIESELNKGTKISLIFKDHFSL